MRFLLAPISWIYALVVKFRNWLYDEGILKSWEADVPTICVGNLAVGGAGKTPHVAYIASLLSSRFKVAVLSRGYKRKTSGFVVATAHTTVYDIGDEAYQLYSNQPDVVVAVCEDRVKGIKQLMQLYPDLQVVILDDGYQHRKLKCGMYVLLTPFNKLYVNDHLVPWGQLREPVDAALRANSIVVTKCPENMQPIDQRVITSALYLPPFQQLYFSSIKYGQLYPLFDEAQPLDPDMVMRPLIVAGIAHPEYLIAHFKQMEINYRILEFADHHYFSKSDIAKIQAKYKSYHSNCIITTEKDAARLVACKYLTEQIKKVLYVLPISADLQTQTDNFNNQILTYVTENNRNR